MVKTAQLFPNPCFGSTPPSSPSESKIPWTRQAASRRRAPRGSPPLGDPQHLPLGHAAARCLTREMPVVSQQAGIAAENQVLLQRPSLGVVEAWKKNRGGVCIGV